MIESKNFIQQIIEDDLASGKHQEIITRFPPEPNGYLHIGHAKSICINFGFAKQYKGTCNLRFDDTNPSKEEEEYVNSIIEDVRWLGFDCGGKVLYASDYFDEMYNLAETLVKKGKAFDNTVYLLYDQSLMIEGMKIEDPYAFAGRLNEMLSKSL